MKTYLRIAEEILEKEQKSLTARQIVKIAIDSGALQTKGKTPEKTMNARLSTDILRKKSDSKFKRSDTGRFALREWQDVEEHISPRRTLALYDEDILVFDKHHLSDLSIIDGKISREIDYNIISGLSYPIRRREAEERYDIIQLVSVFIVKYKNKILTHKRSKRLPEKRLHHVYSLIFGGHLNPEDLAPLFAFSDPETALYMLDRELNEELVLPPSQPKISFVGLLYDSSVKISSQHLGIVFDVELEVPEFDIGERGFFHDAKFETTDEIKSRLNDFENWSVIIVNSLEQ